MKHNSRILTALRGGLMALALMVLAVPAFAQKAEVKGTVTDAESGQPLVGVTVIADSGAGTATDAAGHYALYVDANDALSFDYLGYTPANEKVAGRTTINVVLSPDAKAIDEVVVLGYTSQKKSEISSSIVSLSSEALNDLTTSDVGSMLQGKAAGVLVMNASGQPGEAADIRIRGTGSISAGAGPLYVVDGVAGGSFNPNDVESLTILKDAAATALYGASASGGVIVVTTKSAKSGKTTINFKATAGIKKVNMGRFSPMDGTELYDAQRALYNNDVLFNIQRPAELRDTNFDWVDALFKTGVVQDYYVSAAGKTGKTSYFVSVDHYDEEGTLINTNFVRNAARLNLSTALSDKVHLDVRLSYDRSNNQGVSSWVTLEGAYRSMPWDIPYVLDEEGNPTDEIIFIDSESRPDNGKKWYCREANNVLHNELYNYSRSTAESTVADVQLTWNITDWLMATSTNRFSTSNSLYETYLDARTSAPSSATKGYASESAWWGSGFGTTNLLKAHKEFGDHSIDGIVGWEFGKSFSKEISAEVQNLPNGQTALSNGVMYGIGGYSYPSTSWAWLAQAQYSYKGKYVATASVRYDEISKFAPKARGGYFPGVSAAWLVSEEDFLYGNDAITFLKVRGGYGKTGNDNIEAFLYQDSFSLSGKYEDKVVAVMDRMASLDLGWEEAYMASFGIDATLYNNVNVTLEVYNTLNKNLLLAVPTAPSTGFFERWANVGEVRNRGIELAVDGNVIKTRNLTWNVGFNIGLNRNTVEHLPNGEFLQTNSNAISHLVREGEALGTWYLVKWAGVNPEDGTPLWYTGAKDENGEFILDENGNPETTGNWKEAVAQKVGSATPKFSGGISTELTYKNFSLSMNGSFIYGNSIFNYTRVTLDCDGKYTDYNMQSHENGLGWVRWTKETPNATHPQIKMGGNNDSNSISSRYLEDGSFFRLRNVTLSYNVPSNLLNKIGVAGARVYVSADNIWTATKFSGMDPEVRLETSGNSLAGISSSMYPVPMTVSMGVDVKF